MPRSARTPSTAVRPVRSRPPEFDRSSPAGVSRVHPEARPPSAHRLTAASLRHNRGQSTSRPGSGARPRRVRGLRRRASRPPRLARRRRQGSQHVRHKDRHMAADAGLWSNHSRKCTKRSEGPSPSSNSSSSRLEATAWHSTQGRPRPVAVANIAAAGQRRLRKTPGGPAELYRRGCRYDPDCLGDAAPGQAADTAPARADRPTISPSSVSAISYLRNAPSATASNRGAFCERYCCQRLASHSSRWSRTPIRTTSCSKEAN